MPRLVSCFLLTQKNQVEAEERVGGTQEAKPQPLPSLYPPPSPCACSAALALSAPSFGVILLLPLPMGWSCDQTWGHGAPELARQPLVATGIRSGMGT